MIKKKVSMGSRFFTLILAFVFIFTWVFYTGQISYADSGKFALGNKIVSKDGRGYKTSGNLSYSYYTNYGTKVKDTMYSTAGYHRYLTIDGRKGYCIEFGIKYPTNLGATSLAGSHRLKYLPQGRKLGIKYAGLYGMQPKSTRVPDELKGKCSLGDWYWATQCIMWEFQTGLRTSPASGLSNGHFYNTLKNRPGKYPYKWMLSKMKQHGTIWSFSSRDKESAKKKVIQMKWNQNTSRYEAELVDKYKVFYPMTIGGKISYSKKGSKYSFYSSKAIEEPKVYELVKNSPKTASKLMIWSSGDYGQTMCTSGYSDSVKAYGAFKTEKDGTMSLVKTSDDKKVEGFTFEIYDIKGNKVATAVTDEKGLLTCSLKPGDYIVREVLTEEQAKVYRQPEEVKVTVKSGETSAVDFKNRLRGQHVVIVKKDGESREPLAGATIGVFEKKTGKLVKKEVTDEKGEAVFDLEIGKAYYYKELKAPVGYILNRDKHSFKGDGAKELEFTLLNSREKQGIEITKSDVVTGQVLSGAVYEILDEKGEQLFKGETGESGKWQVSDVPLGKYYYHELKAPNGYKIDDKKYEFKISDRGKIKKINAKDEAIKTSVEKAPDTGDRRMPEAAGFLAIASIATLAVLMMMRRRN